jgi:hypothetical protein
MTFRQAALDGPSQSIQPWPAIAICEWNPSLELGKILLPMEIIGIVEGPVERSRESSPNPGFS